VGGKLASFSISWHYKQRELLHDCQSVFAGGCMLLQHNDFQELDDKRAFGTLLTTLRISSKKKVTQADVVAKLPGWTVSSYSRLENGDIAPRFDQLPPIYQALQQVGILFSLQGRSQFVDLARRRIAIQRTYKDVRTDGEWAQLRFELARLDGLPEPSPGRPPLLSRPLLSETSHLVGREPSREELIAALGSEKKLIVIRGPAGIGKSSELNWLATYLFHHRPSPYRVALCDFRSEERTLTPEESLDIVLGSILTELVGPQPQTPHTSLGERTLLLLEQLERSPHPVVVFVDHCECLLRDNGSLAPCWEHFLSRFLRSQHHSTLVLATRQWPGWFSGEHRFISETALPPLPREKAVFLLQQLGLDSVPVPLLYEVYDSVGGIPLCLEWVAALVKQPLQADDWEEFDAHVQSAPHFTSRKAHTLTTAIQRLLAEPHVFGGNLAEAIAPILDRITANQCLSPEARHLLEVLSVACVPLAKSALAVVSPAGPRPFEELRRASLVVSYPNRAHLLPMVASAVLRRLASEEIQDSERLLIQAYTVWLAEGTFYERESGAVVAELAILLLKHHRLLEAAQLLIRYGWLSFNLGYASRLARLANDEMHRFDWPGTAENECGGFLLQNVLSPFLGNPIDGEKRATEYRRIQDLVTAGSIALEPPTELHVTHHLMTAAMNQLRFHEAQSLLEACCNRLAPLREADIDLRASLLEKRAWLVGTWCEHAEEQGEPQTARALREQVIDFYSQCSALLSSSKELSSLQGSLLKKRLARCFNNIAYHLNRAGRFEEALQAVEHSIDLKEQGYVQVGSLAASYGEKSEALAGLGRFQEALLFDEKAHEDIERCASAGYALSQEDVWMYRVNRGRLFLRVGKINEAEQLLREALPRIHPRRRMYQMFAKEALGEIEQWRLKAASPDYQLDWRWVERYRELASFDSYWWLTPAGPFTEAEQQQWGQWFTRNMNEQAKEQLGKLLAQSRERELVAAIAEQREPHPHYPAIAIQEVRSRIAGLEELQAEIRQHEPNALVRRLYLGAIEEELSFLHLIEATHEGDSERFWECNLRLNPIPTPDEMNYALSRLRSLLLQGLMQPETAEVSQQVIQFSRERLRLSLDLSPLEGDVPVPQHSSPEGPHCPQHIFTPQTAMRFFEEALQQSGYEGWQVEIDANANGARVEQGLRRFFLPNNPLSVDKIRHYLSHELAGHVARCIAGERSLLGLLGIHTKNSLETEEGLAIYHEHQAARLSGQPYDDAGEWIGTLATGLASGVLTPPLTFLSLFAFFEPFLLLRRLLRHLDGDVQTAQKQAKRLALTRCLRTFRGVPDLERPGVCYTKDALYLRGLWKIEQAVAQDETVLDRLAVGVVALEQLPDLRELGIVTPALRLLTKLANDPDLESYLLSFESTPSDENGQCVQGK